MRLCCLFIYFLIASGVSVFSQDADKLIAESQAFEKRCAGIHDLINQSGKIYFYSNENSKRFKVFGENRYRNFKKGDCFLIVGGGKKSYLRDSNSTLYAPTSEISYSFDKYVAPASEYMELLKTQLNECQAAVALQEAVIGECTAQINKNIDQLVVLLADDSINRAVFYDAHGNCIIPESIEISTRKNKLADRLMREVKRLEREIKASGKLIAAKKSEKETITKNLKNLESVLAGYYKKYPQTRPEKERESENVPAPGK